MKTLYTLILALLITPLSYGQNQILNLELIPANPTSSDSVKVVAHLSFSSGSCELDTKDVIQTGTTFAANSHHCLGLATYICEAKDTFSLGVLPDDTYTFYIGLSTGGAPAPCTPGIISDDTDTLQFSVGVPNSINPIAQKHDFRFYPNPAQSQLSFEFENGNQTRASPTSMEQTDDCYSVKV